MLGPDGSVANRRVPLAGALDSDRARDLAR